jgi:hypothetical protein
MNIQILETILKIALNQTQSTQKNEVTQPSGQHIVVLDRGFVYVGEIEISEEWIKISNAKNIRVWGTKKGLGELRDGPTKDTTLDDCGEVFAPRKALISLIPCNGF